MTKTYKTYQFSDLKGKARQRAIEWYRDEYAEYLFDQDDCHMLTETFQNDLESHYCLGSGFEVYWQLSCCQGDGVAFTGQVDLTSLRAHDPVLDGLFKRAMVELDLVGCDEFQDDLNNIGAKVSDDGHHHHHWNTMSVEVERYSFTKSPDEEFDGNRIVEQLCSDIGTYLDEFVKTISREMEKSGYADIEYHSSDEYIAERMDELDYEFTRCGEHVDHG